MRIEHLPADVLGADPLLRDALAGRAAGSGLRLPRRIDELRVPAVERDAGERARLAQALERSLSPRGAHVAVLEAIRALGRPGTWAVVTGQQPGLLGGPLLVLVKALQATRLAEELGRRWGRPVVALFWNHADDHDLAEAAAARFVNPNLELQRAGLAGLSSGRRPLSRVVLREEEQRLGALRALLADSFRDAPHRDEALELFLPRDGETLAQAFTRTWTELLGARGLVVVEPDLVREAASRALAELVVAEPLARLRAASERLAAAGYPVAIPPEEAALLYRVDAEGRRALRAGGDGYRYDDEPGSRTAAELAAQIVEEPGAWSAGALLRPLVQDGVLPVAAYVGGAGELGYHAQLAELRAAAGLADTPFVLRRSCTVVDEGDRAALERLGWTLADVLRARRLESPTLEPHPLALRLRAEAQGASKGLGALRRELAALDPTLPVNLRRTVDAVRSAVERLVDKVERVHANRQGKGRRHVRRLQSRLVPAGEPQERVLGVFELVARYGRGWIEELADELDPFGGEHLALHLEGGAESPEEA